MTIDYDDAQRSEAATSALFLYEFTYGENIALRYAATITPLFAVGRNWDPAAVSHGAITLSGSMDKQTLPVTVPIDSEIARLYQVSPPTVPVELTIYRGLFGTDTFVKHWSGTVSKAAYGGASTYTLTCSPTITTIARRVMRRKYQPGCVHVVYGSEGCTVPAGLHTETGTVTQVVDAVTIDVAMSGPERGITALNLEGGILRITAPDGSVTSRTITSADLLSARNFRLTLISYVYGLTADMSVQLLKGCDHTFATCRDRFGNTPNFGGCPNIPVTDPMRNNSY